jgi:hypothetical protein
MRLAHPLPSPELWAFKPTGPLPGRLPKGWARSRIGPSAALVCDRNAVTAAFACKGGLGCQQQRQLRRSGFAFAGRVPGGPFGSAVCRPSPRRSLVDGVALVAPVGSQASGWLFPRTGDMDLRPSCRRACPFARCRLGGRRHRRAGRSGFLFVLSALRLSCGHTGLPRLPAVDFVSVVPPCSFERARRRAHCRPSPSAGPSSIAVRARRAAVSDDPEPPAPATLARQSSSRGRRSRTRPTKSAPTAACARQCAAWLSGSELNQR